MSPLLHCVSCLTRSPCLPVSLRVSACSPVSPCLAVSHRVSPCPAVCVCVCLSGGAGPRGRWCRRWPVLSGRLLVRRGRGVRDGRPAAAAAAAGASCTAAARRITQVSGETGTAHSAARSTAQHGTSQHSTAQHNMVQYNTDTVCTQTQYAIITKTQCRRVCVSLWACQTAAGSVTVSVSACGRDSVARVLGLLLNQGAEWKIQTENQHEEWKIWSIFCTTKF